MTPMRPSFHFTAENGWINDPHGLTFHDGEYHLFHQYVPDSPVWAPNCHWGHATSPDLLDWTRRGVAIAPGEGDDGIWTGSVVVDDERARILYTSVVEPNLGLGRVRVATPDDESWDTWTKGDLVVRPPGDLDLIAFRDPFVIREHAAWRMFVGAATRDGQALALTYTSEDLRTWTYDGVALSRSTHEVEPVWMGALWECPQIFEVDGHWVMVSSVWDDDVLHYAGYAIGGPDSYRDGRFSPTDWGQLSFGESYYAPSFFHDRHGRPCLIFWMRGVTDPQHGWASCLSIPYLLSVRAGRLVAEPHPEIAAHRGHTTGDNLPACAIDVEWMPNTGDRLTFDSPRGKCAHLLVEEGSIVMECPGHENCSMPWSGGPVRVIADGPVLEVCSADGVMGGPIQPAETWFSPHGNCTAWSLAATETAPR